MLRVICLLLILDAECMVYGQSNPRPTLNKSSPSRAAVGDQDITLTLTGSGFIQETIVLWNNVDLTPTLINQQKLTVVIPSAFLSISKTNLISIINPPPRWRNIS